MKIKRKGMSTVIATVLLILITITAAGIIGGFLIPYVKNNLDKSSECLPYENYFKFEEEIAGKNLNCFKLESPNTANGITVRAFQTENAKPEDVKGFDVIFVNRNGSTILREFVQNTEKNIGVGGTWMIEGTSTNVETRDVAIPQPRDIISYGTLTAGSQDTIKAEISAILKSGRMCGKSDTIVVNKCDNSIKLH